MTKYRTIVADPPWDHNDGTGWSYGDANVNGGRRGPITRTFVPYKAMTVQQITDLPVSDLAATDAHLYLWTTNRFLHDAYHVAEAWGFHVSKPLIWCKAPKGFFGRPFVSSAEFILYAWRGSPGAIGHANRQWWTWRRGAHSVKPDAFLDVVEQVSPGPYLEMFARRARFGWEYWGDESLETIELPA